MASEIDICNLALANLGDSATITSIDPPEGSAQAEHCQRFYPIARDMLLEMHSWKFATRRVLLAALTSSTWNWEFAYAEPSGALRILSILPAESPAESDSQPFETMSGDSGESIIFTDLEDASCIYTAAVTDPGKFSPLFTSTLSWLLSSMLAGPILKGEAGRAESKRCLQVMQNYLSQAKVSDANQRNAPPEHVVPWISDR